MAYAHNIYFGSYRTQCSNGRRGVVDLGERRIRIIELLPTARLGTAPDRLHGTVRTRQGDFTGFVQWNREECVGTDELDGHTTDGFTRMEVGAQNCRGTIEPGS